MRVDPVFHARPQCPVTAQGLDPQPARRLRRHLVPVSTWSSLIPVKVIILVMFLCSLLNSFDPSAPYTYTEPSLASACHHPLRIVVVIIIIIANIRLYS